MVISEDQWHSILFPSVWQLSCHQQFSWLRSIATEYPVLNPDLPHAWQTHYQLSHGVDLMISNYFEIMKHKLIMQHHHFNNHYNNAIMRGSCFVPCNVWDVYCRNQRSTHEQGCEIWNSTLNKCYGIQLKRQWIYIFYILIYLYLWLNHKRNTIYYISIHAYTVGELRVCFN